MSYWSHNPELYDEITIAELPEPYKTWCENGEKPYPWWRFTLRYPVYRFLQKIESWFPNRFGTRFIDLGVNSYGHKCNRYVPAISQGWYPWGREYSLDDVPDQDLVFKARIEGERNYWGDQVDHAKEQFDGELLQAGFEGPEAIQAVKERWGVKE